MLKYANLLIIAYFVSTLNAASQDVPSHATSAESKAQKYFELLDAHVAKRFLQHDQPHRPPGKPWKHAHHGGGKPWKAEGRPFTEHPKDFWHSLSLDEQILVFLHIRDKA